MIGRLLCAVGVHRRRVYSRHRWCGFDGLGDVESQRVVCRRSRCRWSTRRVIVHKALTRRSGEA